MNEIVNNFSLTVDKLMPEMHLRQPGFTCTARGPFIKNKKYAKIQRKSRFTIYFSKQAR